MHGLPVAAVMAAVFSVGYLFIALEHRLSVNKAATALVTAVLCWVLISAGHFPRTELALELLNHHLADIAQVIIFLLGAMTIVELINVYDGFRFISGFITTRDRRSLLWIISFLTFFISSFLDNLTTSIIMVLLLRRFVPDKKERFIFAGMIIVAANAGGAWSPIGDVTTTMLWMDDRVSSLKLITGLFLPSAVSVIIPMILFSLKMKAGSVAMPAAPEGTPVPAASKGAKRVLGLGVGALVFVPVLRDLTGLPPYMGIILGLGLMWMMTDTINQERHFLRVPHVLAKIDISSVLFFLGILLAVAALETVGLLDSLAGWMDTNIRNKDTIIAGLGLLSALIDNVPLTAAVMGMYDLAAHPIDAPIWHMSAYCLGTGGSLLIIGSAAGVVVMGMENIKFTSYLKKITLPALLGYLGGLTVLLLMS